MLAVRGGTRTFRLRRPGFTRFGGSSLSSEHFASPGHAAKTIRFPQNEKIGRGPG
jgi:hypothetical protein